MRNFTHYKCDQCGQILDVDRHPRIFVPVAVTNHCNGNREVYQMQLCPSCFDATRSVDIK